jgi:hypothetical protein
MDAVRLSSPRAPGSVAAMFNIDNVTSWARQCLMRCLPPLITTVVVATTAVVRAECPTQPSDPTCRPWTAIAMPTLFATAYRPADAGGWWYGAGLEAAFLTWSDNSPTFGPSHGKLRLDVAILRSSSDDRVTMAMYRGGGEVSFERNASRTTLIPYFAVDLGGIWTEATGSRIFVDGGLGLYLWHRRGVVFSVEAVAVLPFSDPDTLAGIRTQLTGSVSLW